jgi:hypothetical protein
MINNSHEGYVESIHKQESISIDFLKNLINLYQKSFNEPYVTTVIERHQKLFSLLRSKIFPDNLLHQFTEDFFYAFIAQNKTVHLYCVLASPTALKELRQFINFITIFKLFDSYFISPHFILVDWPSANANTPDSAFLNLIDQIDNTLKAQLNLYHLHVVSPLENHQLRKSYFDASFTEEFEHIRQLIDSFANTLYHQKTDLDVDIMWATNFYDRQDSLHELGREQAILDLEIRRGIGAYINRKLEQFSPLNQSCFLVTSELNKRFLKCYATKAPIINITVNN